MQIKSVLIAGAGAIGLTVADTLLKYDAKNVRILAGGERLERYEKNGLFVNGKKLDVQFAVASSAGAVSASGATSASAVHSAGTASPGDFSPDLIIISCKAHHLNQVLDDMAPYVGKDTLILSLLNGISSEEIIGKRFGAERIPLAMIIGTDAGHAGTETTFSKRGIINFGDPKNNVAKEGARNFGDAKNCSPRVQAIAEYFDKAGLPFEIPFDMSRKLWYKFMLNVGINQCSAVLKMPYAPFQSSVLANGEKNPRSSKEARELFVDAMREVIAVAACEHISLTESDITELCAVLDTISPDGKTSMCQDVCAGRKTEVELFSETVISLGKKHNVPTPINSVLYKQLRMLESRGV